MRSQRVLMELVDEEDISIKVLVSSPMSMSLLDLASLTSKDILNIYTADSPYIPRPCHMTYLDWLNNSVSVNAYYLLSLHDFIAVVFPDAFVTIIWSNTNKVR
jgi:hypothetical protein